MRLFFYGRRFDISTEALSYTKVHEGLYVTRLFSMEARICAAPTGVYVRMQDVLAGRRDYRELLVSWSDIEDLVSQRYRFSCIHLPPEELLKAATPTVKTLREHSFCCPRKSIILPNA